MFIFQLYKIFKSFVVKNKPLPQGCLRQKTTMNSQRIQKKRRTKKTDFTILFVYLLAIVYSLKMYE